MAEKIIIAELDIDEQALLRAAADTKSAIDSIRESNKQLKKSTEDTTKEQVKNEAALKKLTKQYNMQKNTLAAVTDENNKLVASEKALEDALNETINTENQATKSNQRLLAIRKDINANTEEGRKRVEQINAKIDENNKLLFENASTQGKVKIGIGDYEGALRRVFPNVAAFTDGLKDTVSGLKAQRSALQASTAATTGTSKALRILRVALISTGIGAIVVALGTLIAAFSSTQAGADKISEALAPIKGAIQGIIGVVQNLSLNVFDQLGDRWTIVSGSLLNGIDKIRAGWERLTGDLDSAAEIEERIAQRTIDIDMAQASLNETTAKFTEILQGSGRAISDAAKAQEEIVALQIEIEQAEIRLIRSRAESNRIIKENNKIAEDTTRTLEEREAAAARAIQESENLLKAEQDIIDLQIRQTELKNSQNDTDRQAERELAELQAKRNEAETQQLELQTTLQNKLNIIRKETAAVEAERLTKLEEENATELDQIREFEDKKRELQNQIDLENAETEEEKAVLKAEQDFEKQQLELERLQLEEEQKTELLALLEQNKENVLADIRQTARDENLKKIIEANKKELAADKSGAEARKKVAQELTSTLTGLLGEGVGAQLAAVAIEAAAEAGLVGIDTASAQARNLAQATAAAPPPFNAPLIAAANTQNVAMGARSTSAIGKIFASAAIKSVGNLARAAFYEGGQVPRGTGGAITASPNIPTQDGGDNILATVKRGEVILNEEQQRRAGGSAFFRSIGVPGFQTGGIAGTASAAQINQSQQMNIEELSDMLAEKINAIKVVAIESEITDAQVQQAEIVSGADV